jgi:hypothetical protein
MKLLRAVHWNDTGLGVYHPTVVDAKPRRKWKFEFRLR